MPKPTVEITWEHLQAAMKTKPWGLPGLSRPEAIRLAVRAADVELPYWSFTMQSDSARMSAAGVNVAAVGRLVKDHVDAGDLVELSADEYLRQLGHQAPSGLRGSQRCVLLATQYDDMVIACRRERHEQNVKRLRDEAEAEVLARHHEEIERLLAHKLANYATLNVSQA